MGDKLCPFNGLSEKCDKLCALYLEDKSIVVKKIKVYAGEGFIKDYDEHFTGCSLKAIALKK